MVQFKKKIICEKDNTVIYNTNNPLRLEKSSTAKTKGGGQLSTTYILCWGGLKLSTWICLSWPLFFSLTLSFTVWWLTSIFCLLWPTFPISYTLSTLLGRRRFSLHAYLMQHAISTSIATINPTAIHQGQSKFWILSQISESIDVGNVEFPRTQRNTKPYIYHQK